MNHRGSVLTAGEVKQKIVVKHIPIQENLPSRQVQKSVPSESSFQSFQSMQALVDQMFMRIQAIGEQYAIKVRSATAELVNHVDETIESSPASRRHKSNIHQDIKNAENVFDGQTANFWHTQWGGAQPGHPHRLIIDLAQARTISGFRYVPRQGAAGVTGRIKDYRIFVADDMIEK